MSKQIKRKVQHAAEVLDAQYRVSKRGVPHVVTRNFTASICWFGKTQIWRVFEPAFGPDQIRSDFKTLDEVKQYLDTGAPFPV